MTSATARLLDRNRHGSAYQSVTNRTSSEFLPEYELEAALLDDIAADILAVTAHKQSVGTPNNPIVGDAVSWFGKELHGAPAKPVAKAMAQMAVGRVWGGYNFGYVDIEEAVQTPELTHHTMQDIENLGKRSAGDDTINTFMVVEAGLELTPDQMQAAHAIYGLLRGLNPEHFHIAILVPDSAN